MKISKITLLILVFLTFTFSANLGKLILQQGSSGYTGCMDASLNREKPSTKYAGSDSLIMHNFTDL